MILKIFTSVSYSYPKLLVIDNNAIYLSGDMIDLYLIIGKDGYLI